MKRNVSWTIGLWQAIGKEIRTKGHGYVGAANSSDVAILWASSPSLYNACVRAADGNPPTQDEFKELVKTIQEKSK